MNAQQLMNAAKTLAGEVKEDKRAAEKRFFTPAEAEARMRMDAGTIERLNRALLFMATEFVQRARPQAIDALAHFEDFRRNVSGEANRDAEAECILMLDWALWFYAEEQAGRLSA